MVSRRSVPSRSVQRVKSENPTQPDIEGEGSPDPLALTPAPTGRPRRTRALESSPAPSSTQAPSSELRTGSGGRKTRLRSGRRSKGQQVEDALGDEDLVARGVHLPILINERICDNKWRVPVRLGAGSWGVVFQEFFLLRYVFIPPSY